MITYTSLRDIQKKEMESAAIISLEKNFYEEASQFLAKKKEEALASTSIMTIKEYENVKKIILAVRAKREEKIVLMALRSEVQTTGLTKEEEDMVRDLRALVSNHRKHLNDVFSQESSIANSNLRKVKILKDVERYKGLNNVIYGPFKIGEEQFLPFEEAEWLLKSRLAESV